MHAGAKEAAAEAAPHPGPPPFVASENADPNVPETSVYFEHGKKHVVHDGEGRAVRVVCRLGVCDLEFLRQMCSKTCAVCSLPYGCLKIIKPAINH